MSISERLEQDAHQAMKDRDELKVSTLRMLLAAVRNKEIDKKRVVLGDDDIIAVLASELKKRKEAAEAFRAGGRADSAEKELKEAAIISAYLPEELSEAELENIIKEAIKETSSSAGDFGKVMKILMPKIKGRADGSKVSELVKKLLADANN